MIVEGERDDAPNRREKTRRSFENDYRGDIVDTYEDIGVYTDIERRTTGIDAKNENRYKESKGAFGGLRKAGTMTTEDLKEFEMAGEIPATDEERFKIMTEDYEIPEEKAKELLEKFKSMGR